MEFLIHPQYPGRKMKRKPKTEKPPIEDRYFYIKNEFDRVLDNVEKFTVGLPVSLKEEIAKNIQKDMAARWLTRYDIEDILTSREEYEELPGATGLAVTVNPFEWVKDPKNVISGLSKDAWKSITDSSDYGNEFKWEFDVGPKLAAMGMARRDLSPATVHVFGLGNVNISGRYKPIYEAGSTTELDPLSASLREFVRFRSAWPTRWTKGLMPARAVALFRIQQNLDNADPLRVNLRAENATYVDSGVLHTEGLLDAQEDTKQIKKQVSVVNANKEEADYAKKINEYWKEAGRRVKAGTLTSTDPVKQAELTKLTAVIRFLDNEELANVTNDMMQAVRKKAIIRTYAWRYFRSKKIFGKTIQDWYQDPIDFIKEKFPVVKNLNRGLTKVLTGKTWGPDLKNPGKFKFNDPLPGKWQGIGHLLDNFQTAALSKVTKILEKTGVSKLLGTAFGAALGAATSGVAVVVMAVTKNIIGKVAGDLIKSAWEQKGNVFLVIGGCGCLLFASPILVMVVILSGFKIPMDRVGVGGADTLQSSVRITKTADPMTFSNDVPVTDRRVTYTVKIENQATEQASVNNLVDNKASIPESSFDLPAGQTKTITYTGMVDSSGDADGDGRDFAYINTVGGSATISGKTVNIVASAVVIVGTPPDMRPAGWPTSGTITQGPGCSYSHGGYAAVDIADDLNTPIKATHDGVVKFSGFNGAYGKTVIIENAYSQTRYSHMESILVSAGASVYPGMAIGTMGRTGTSSKITGVHLHYEIERLVSFDGDVLPWNERLVNVSGLFFVPETVSVGLCENWHTVSSSY